MHRYSVGANVYYEPSFGAPAAPGEYKVVRQLPVERDNRLSYRIKSASESFERIAEEHQLSRGDSDARAAAKPRNCRIAPPGRCPKGPF
jgi:hypothetical protein